MAFRLLFVAACAMTVSAQDAERSAALWGDIKAQLTKPDGREWWELHTKDAVVPGRGEGIDGAVLSSDPADHPRKLVVAVQDGSIADTRLQLERPLQRPISKGAVIVFEGVAVDYTLEPFVLAFDAVRVLNPLTSRDRKAAPRLKPAR